MIHRGSSNLSCCCYLTNLYHKNTHGLSCPRVRLCLSEQCLPNWPVFWFGCGRQQKRHAAAPPPTGVRRRMERNRQKLGGRDKGSLTQQQTKGTGTTTIRIRGIHKTKQTTQQSCSPEPPPPRTPEPQVSSPHPAPRPGTQHDITWCGIPCSVWPDGVSPPGCAPSWIPVKINPVLAEPRTACHPFWISTILSSSCMWKLSKRSPNWVILLLGKSLYFTEPD